MSKLKIAFVPIARTTFDIAFAQEKANSAREKLRKHIGTVVGPDELITDMDGIEKIIAELKEAALDTIVVFQATFADSTMIITLAEGVDTPLFLWAVPEAHTGGRLRLNSFCGINLAGHAMTRAGYRYGYVFAAPDDPSATKKITTFVRAGHARRLLGNARLGRIGENPIGFETCLFNPEELKQRFGIDVIQYSLQDDIFPKVRQIPTNRTTDVANALSKKIDKLDEMDAEAVQASLGTYLRLQEISKNEDIQGFAVRCWPEFFTDLGCAACGAMSMLSDEMIPCSCEADVHGNITQMMLQWLSDEPAFLTDMVSVDKESDAMVLWHCGLAPLSMADPEAEKSATIHSNRQLPLLMEFPLKPGQVTAARLTRVSDELELVIGSGRVLRSSKIFSGTSGLLKFDRPINQVVDDILGKGLEHHIAITYGNHIEELRILAKLLDLPLIELT